MVMDECFGLIAISHVWLLKVTFEVLGLKESPRDVLDQVFQAITELGAGQIGVLIGE